MKLLITGGCGFLGSNLAAHAISRGDDLIVFDNLHRQGSIENLKWLQGQGTFKFVHGDIRNFNDVLRTTQAFRPDAIFHLAGQVAMTTSTSDPRTDFEVNTLGTLNILEAVRLASPNVCLIYSSTNKVYGDLEQFTYRETETRFECIEYPRGFNESVQLSFHSPYGCSKGAADQYMLDYCRIFNLNTIVFRHSSMYGGRQFATFDQGWIGWFCQKAAEAKAGKQTEPFTISGSGKQVRDVLHAEDMVQLYFGAIEHISLARGQAFNIGGGIDNSLSLIELLSILERLTKTKLDYKKLNPRESDQRVFVADVDKARRLLQWEPTVAPIAGIEKMLNWVHSEAIAG